MGTPATLTDIDGIGTATAKKLAAAGMKTVAALALADVSTLEALSGMPSGAKFADWIVAAKKLKDAAEKNTGIHEASGADAETKGAAASDDEAEAKVSEARGTDAADPAGTAGASAAQADESREQAPTASTDRKDAQGEEKQPGATAQPPVAEHDVPVLVVTGPKKGFRRGGYRFGKEPTIFTDASFVKDIDGMRRILAILGEDKLTCAIRYPDGVEQPVDRQAAADLYALVGSNADFDADTEQLAELSQRVFGRV